jgi:hypothetical protein
MYVFPLTADFLHFQDVPGVLLPGPKLVEAPAFFRQGAAYTVLLGGCTCMGLWGGGVAALTAPHPLAQCRLVLNALAWMDAPISGWRLALQHPEY